MVRSSLQIKNRIGNQYDDNYDDHDDDDYDPQKIPPRMSPLDLEAATTLFRKQLARISQVMEQDAAATAAAQQSSSSSSTTTTAVAKSPEQTYRDMTVDISPLYDIVVDALETVGAKGLYFRVFSDGELDWWFDILDRPNGKEQWVCWETHGSNLCGPHEPWWFYHYIGAITAEKLLDEGRLLWDPVTGETVQTPAEFMLKLHVTQDEEKHAVGDMSFHAQHAFLWQYVATTRPNLDRFPDDITKELCGDYYAFHKVKSPTASKIIGYECFHGMGHAIFYAVARQQMMQQYPQQMKKSLTARIQYKPSAGLILTQESWCKIYKLCQTDLSEVEGYIDDAAVRCIGGARHSVRIFSADGDMRWHYTTPTKVRNQYFDDEMEKCIKLEEQ